MTATTATPYSRDLTAWERDRLAFHYSILDGDPECVAELEATEQTWVDLPAPPACPPWCSQTAGHGWVDSDARADGADSCRFHSADFGPPDRAFHVSQLETAHRDGTTVLHAPDILLPEDMHRDPITDPLVIVDVAHAALDAAALLRQIIDGTDANWSVTR